VIYRPTSIRLACNRQKRSVCVKLSGCYFCDRLSLFSQNSLCCPCYRKDWTNMSCAIIEYLQVYIVACMGDCRRCFGLDTGFIDHLYTQRRTTSNYSAIANLHTLQITTAHAKSFPASCVFSSHSLATSYNSESSSAPALMSTLNDSFLHRLPYRSDLVATVVFLATLRHGLRRQHTVHSRMLTVSAAMCLPSSSLAAAVYSCLLRICCLSTDVVPLSISRPLPRYDCCFWAVR
jgi:hypothetical protein